VAALVLEWEDAVRGQAAARSLANLKKGSAVPDRVKAPTREKERARTTLAKMANVTENKIRDMQAIKATKPEALHKIQRGELRVRDLRSKVRDLEPADDWSARLDRAVRAAAVADTELARSVVVPTAFVSLAVAIRAVDPEMFERLCVGEENITGALKATMRKFEQLEKQDETFAQSLKDKSPHRLWFNSTGSGIAAVALKVRDDVELQRAAAETVKNADQVLEKGIPELVKALSDGTISVKTGAAIAQLGKDEQRKEVERWRTEGQTIAAREPQEERLESITGHDDRQVAEKLGTTKAEERSE
jgi:hypothetical protein